MQIAPSVTTAHVLPAQQPVTTAHTLPATAPAFEPHGPIGVGSVATLHVGYALNGVRYQDIKVLAPVTAPLGSFDGSLADAVTGAQTLLRTLATKHSGSHDGVEALALFHTADNKWMARSIYADPSVLRVIDTKPGTGGITSAEFADRSSDLAALVTLSNALYAPSRLGNTQPNQ